MILTLYDKTHNYVGSIVKKNDLKIESQLDNGDKTLSFVHMDESIDVTPECYIRDGQDEYVVKEIDRTTTGFPVIYAALNLEELEGKAWKTFQAEDCTISEAAQLAITGTGWTVAGSDVSKKRNAGIVKKSALGVLQDLCTAFMCEMSFDTINKTITFHAQRGSDRGVYFLAGLNLLQLTKKSDSYDFYTRIVPYGADGLDIKEVNSGQEYLDNNQYSSKVRTYIWEDTNYTDAQALKDDAAAKLADMSKPKVSYSAQVIDLAEMSADYGLLDYSLGDTVTLIDKNTGTRDKQRIVRLTEYPEEPDRNTCEMSNTFLTWEEMQAKLQASAAIVDALIGSDGNYNGTIKVSDILHFTDGVVGTSSGSNVTLGNFFQTTTGAIGALNLEVGQISANMLTAETADLRYANITFGNLDTANINTAKVKDLFVQVGLIKDAVISGAKITGYLDAVEVNAANITAGTLIADRIAIRGSTTSLVYALNNYGQIVSQQTNTLDGYILTERTINANKIVANSITGGEIAANTITAFNIVGNSLSAIYADLGEITAGVLKSNNYNYSSGNYSTDGMMIDLNNKIYRTPNTAILGDGSFYTKSGTIGPWTIGSTGIYNGKTGLGDNTVGVFVGISGIEYETANSVITLDKTYGVQIKSKSTTGESHGFRISSRDGSYTQLLNDSVSGWSRYNNTNKRGFDLYSALDSSNNAYGVLELGGHGVNKSIFISSETPSILITSNSDVGILRCYSPTTADTYNIIRNHNNGNISVSAASGGLYLGYENTTSINFFNGKATIDTNGHFAAGSYVTSYAGLILRNGTLTKGTNPSAETNRIIVFTDKDGYSSVGGDVLSMWYGGGVTTSGNSYSIIRQYKYAANDTTNYAQLLVGYSTYPYVQASCQFEAGGDVISTNASGEAHVYARNSATGNRIFIYATSSNGTAGLYSYSADNTSRPILVRANNSNDITAYGEWTFNSGGIRSRNTSANAWIQAENGANVNAIAITSDSAGTVRLWSRSADGATRTILQRANNSSDVTAYGAWTFNGGVVGNNGASGMPIVSDPTNGWRVAYFTAYNATTLQVGGQWGSTSAYATKNITVSSSDIRLKEHIEDTTVSALPIVNSIRMREFDWKDGRHQSIGFIADELEELDGKLSIGGGKNENGTMNIKSVDTFYLLGYAIKAIQELSAEVSRLKGAA